MSIKSVLLSGAGNTFHIIYNLKNGEPSSQLVRIICEQNPADGVVFLKTVSSESNTYQWDFYNNDGSLAEMCGNAARCVGYYIKHVLKNDASKFILKTVAGQVDIKPIPSTMNDRYEVKMPAAKILKHKEYFFCNTGVPHVVIETSVRENFLLRRKECEQIRHHADFAPQGTNVTLFYKVSEMAICAQTFERGVEDFTEACGTGAVAASLYMREKYNVNKVMVEMPGGQLTIDVTDLDHPIMVGYVKHIKDCTYDFSI